MLQAHYFVPRCRRPWLSTNCLISHTFAASGCRFIPDLLSSVPSLYCSKTVPILGLFQCFFCTVIQSISKVNKGIPQQAEVVLEIPGRLRPRIFSTFGTTRVVGRQPYAPAAFTPGEIPGTHFQGLSRPQGTWFCRKKPRKKSQVTPPGIDPGTVRLVAQRLNHYATPDPDSGHR